jgi:hypothetical protein
MADHDRAHWSRKGFRYVREKTPKSTAVKRAPTAWTTYDERRVALI